MPANAGFFMINTSITTTKLHISQIFGIDAKENDLDFFDANLFYDSRLFIDPFLLKRSPVKKEQELYKRFSVYFKTALNKTLNAGKKAQDIKNLENYLSFSEPKEICLGYTENSNAGSGLGKEFATALYKFFINGTTAKILTKEDLYPDKAINPEVFAVFAEKVAQDGISDLSANLIMDYLVEYTQAQCKKWNIPCKTLPVSQTFDFEEMEWTEGQHYFLPENIFKPGEPIVFVPKRLLRANDNIQQQAKSKVIGILRSDPRLAEKFSRLIEKPIKDISIKEIREVMSEDFILKKYISSLENQNRKSYDFEEDPLYFLAFKKFGDFFLNKNRLAQPNSCLDILNHTNNLISYFKEEFEKKDGWRDAWTMSKNGLPTPRNEDAWGRTFRAMGCAYFVNYPEVTFQSEAESGNGPLDFLIIYKDCRIAIEIKKLSNNSATGVPSLPAYIHGISRQLPHYTINLKAKYAFYITGQHYKEIRGKKPINHDNRADEIRQLLPSVKEDIKKQINSFQELYYENIDLSPKPSASKL